MKRQYIWIVALALMLGGVVVFLGVNVNVKANAIADVLETTREWRLDEIPSWHFLTGDA